MLRRLAKDERGFTLTELLVSMVVGSIVLWALMTIFVSGVQGTAKVGDRVEAQQRGRLAMDRVETVLNSMVCLDATKAPIIAGTDQTATLYADLGDVSFTPKKYRFVYDSTAKTLTEEQYDGTGTVPNLTFPAIGSPTRTMVLGTNIAPVKVAGVAQPIFRYFRFETDGTVNPNNPLTTPLDTTTATATNYAGQVVRVSMAFQALPERTKAEDARAITIDGQAVAGSSDPEDPADGPNC